MADRSRAGIEATFKLGKGTKAAPARGGIPLRMLVVADFGGHRSRGETRSLAEARPQRVDLDSFGAVMRKVAPQLSIAIGDQAPLLAAFGHLDDFHPDYLFAEWEFFAPLRELRRQLQDGKAFERAAALLGQVALPTPTGPVAATPADDGDLLRLLGRPATAAAPAAATAAGTVDALIRQAVAPHIVGKADPRQAQLIAAVDGMTGELMRAVLHDPGFQRLEAAWRGVDRLVHGLELDERLQLFILDASRDELAADFAATPNLASSAMYRILVEHGTGVPWSLVVYGTPCGRRTEDATLLGQLGTLAQEVDAAVVAGLDWQAWTAGFVSLDDQRACAALRASTAAGSVAVATPGIRLRAPYGKGTDPIESFAFTEQSTPPLPEHYLWGSAAFAVAELLAKSYTAAEGWDFEPEGGLLDDLPLHFFERDGEKEEAPATQAWLTESKVDDLLKDGFIPLVAAKGRGEVHVPRIQSIASPPAALAGRWGQGARAFRGFPQSHDIPVGTPSSAPPAGATVTDSLCWNGPCTSPGCDPGRAWPPGRCDSVPFVGRSLSAYPAVAALVGLSGCLLYTDPINEAPKVTIEGPETVERGYAAEYRATVEDEDYLLTVEWAAFDAVNQGCSSITNADWYRASVTQSLDRYVPFEFEPDTLDVKCICARVTDSHGAVGFSSPCVRLEPKNVAPEAKIVDVEGRASGAPRPLCSTIHLSAAGSEFPTSKNDQVDFTWSATDPSGASIPTGDCSGVADDVKAQHFCFYAGVPGTYTVTLSITDTPLVSGGGGPLTSHPVSFVAQVAADRPAYLRRTDPEWDAQVIVLSSSADESRTFEVTSVDDDCEPIPAPAGKKEARLLWSIWDGTQLNPKWDYQASSSKTFEISRARFPNALPGDTVKIRVEVRDTAADKLYQTPGYSPCPEQTDRCCEGDDCTADPPHVRWTTWTVLF